MTPEQIEAEAEELGYNTSDAPIEFDFNEAGAWISGRRFGYIAGRSKGLERTEELEEGLRKIITLCEDGIVYSMGEYAKTKDNASENMYATECMVYGIVKDKLKQLLNN